MTRTSTAIRLLTAFVAALALVGFCVAGSLAQSSGEATITIHKATCPENTGADIFTQCHDNALADISFDINSVTVTTGSDGHASTTVDPGTVTVTEDAGDFANYTGARVFCSEQASQNVLIDASVPSGTVSFTASAGDDIICDWYDLTAAVVQTPTTGPTAVATATTVPAATNTPSTTTLPSTGTGDTGGSSNGLLLIAGALLAVIGGAFALRKRQLS
jgi:hypothetical protein